ncbi:MAG TPA: dihydroorotate dehydrogenase [Syntrophomonadaceae bacterium]|nr:dihydroorotate dehydrogenase [Syntrophomonadaceae bacterium]HNX29135.1 dihydroorotate dehydrogenase [Syntrophomonadaceae bacterium]HPR93692.1 dihydroorotate dehydrogenase [Syntrophomonadaceae bacterium]
MKKDEKMSVKPDLSVTLGPVKLNNPITAASGTFGYGTEYQDYLNINKLGAVIVKGTTLGKRAGNPPPRIIETASGMLNAIGLENPGIEVFLKQHLPRLRENHVNIILNIAGNTIDEYAKICSLAEGHEDILAIELNISCPNVARGGLQFGTDPDTVEQVVRAVKNQTAIPIIPKLSPNVTDIVQIAQAAKAGGADAVSMINTLMGMAIDIKKRRPVLGNVFGGLSGPAIKPVALRMIYQVYKAVDIPILGGGGIMNTEDALEFIMAGASAISVGTGLFVNPRLPQAIIDGLYDYMAENSIASLEEIKGAAVI